MVTLLRDKNYWHRKYKKNKSLKNKENFYSLKESVKLALEKYESLKMKKYIKSLGLYPLTTKPIWRRINRVRNGKRKSEIPTLVKDGVKYDNDQKKADIFAERMKSVFNEEHSPGKFDDKSKNT